MKSINSIRSEEVIKNGKNIKNHTVATCFVLMLFITVISLVGCNKEKESESIFMNKPEKLNISHEQTQAVLSWEAINGAEGYNIYQAESRYGDYIIINKDLVTETNYNVDGGKDYYYRVTATAQNTESELSEPASYEMNLFGSNVYIFNPKDDPKQISDFTSKTFKKQETNQFGLDRYAYLLKPGTYDESIEIKVGYYTHVAGLGTLPTDTIIKKLTCDARWLGGNDNHNATCNFWRAAENFTANSDTLWAVSQAVSLRRMNINGNLYLHDNGGWASGGFLADSVVSKEVNSGSQQQWFSRNDDWGNWNGQNWNMVFAGIEEGKAPVGSWPEKRFTVANEIPVIQEKPFLVYDKEAGYGVFLPNLRTDAVGISWQNDANGSTIPLDEFYIAKPESDTADSINAALSDGKHILFTPGIYKLDKALQVTKPNTIVLGIGLATLIPTNGNRCMEVADEDGIMICSLLFDAGELDTDTLLEVGKENSTANHENSPISLSDLYFRVGGVIKNETKAESCVIINSNNVVGDNFWVWRADHGDGVAWDMNYGKNGIIVNGDDVIFYALMVEHFQEYQTIWNGERGKTYFYQSEIPYDVPNQEVWMNGDINGFASYKVNDDVKEHMAMGLGIYLYNRDATVYLNSAMEVPDTPGVEITNACTVMLTGNPGLSHIINNSGAAVLTGGARRDILYYANGEAVEFNPEEGTKLEEGLAFNKSAVVSSIEGGYDAQMAVDGDGSTRWASDWTDDEWIYIDLGETKSFSKITLSWEAAFAKEYQILVSNDLEDWQLIVEDKAGDGGIDEISFDKVEARYVKLQGIKRATEYGYSLWTFEVYE